MDKNEIDEDALKTQLSEEEYKVLREGGTEAPFSGEYLNPPDGGVYRCKVCGAALFKAESQEDPSKSPAGLQGWPSFGDAIAGAVDTRLDTSHGMRRTEVVCANCHSHLGHLFDDPGMKTGEHYCINSVCLTLEGN